MEMEQKDVHFDVPTFSWTSDYEKAGEPTLYFEFNQSAYYGLVAIQGGRGPFWKRAVQTYTETVLGDDTDTEIEIYPKQISRAEALLKFLLAPDRQHETVHELTRKFDDIKSGLVLVDSSLL